MKHLLRVAGFLLTGCLLRAEEKPVDTKDRNYPKDPPIEAPRPETYPPEIRVEGRWLRDPGGNQVWLQGVAIPGLEITSKGHGAVRSAIVAIEEWKANVIRLAIKDEFWYGKGTGARADDEAQSDGGAAYRALVDAAVQAAANRGAYVVIDHHRYRAVRPEHLPFWKDVAERYKNHPAVIFDIINESHGISWEVWRNGGWVAEKSGVDESAFLSEEEKKKNEGFESVGMQGLVDAVRSTGAIPDGTAFCRWQPNTPFSWAKSEPISKKWGSLPPKFRRIPRPGCPTCWASFRNTGFIGPDGVSIRVRRLAYCWTGITPRLRFGASLPNRPCPEKRLS